MTGPGFARACYVVAVRTWGIPPSEFWAMAIREFFWLVQDHEKRHPARTQEWAGTMTDADVKAAGEFLRSHQDNGQ